MRAFLPVAALAAALGVTGCGNDSSCSVSDAPPPPSTTLLNTGTRTLTWSAVPNASSYNLYLKVVENCDSLDPNTKATAADQKFANVSSPFDLSAFNHCHTCYYEALTSVRGNCESAPLGGGGFTLLPCT
jgi:hypothetical protein